MKRLTTFALAVMLVGPPTPAPDRGQKVEDMTQLEHHNSRRWTWIGVAATVAAGSVLAYEVSRPKPRDRRIGGVCCGPNCLLTECHTPPGGY